MKIFRRIFSFFDTSDPVPDFALYEQLIERLATTETLQNELRVKLTRAFELPESFYDLNSSFYLADRGLRYPADRLLTPKFVLIDTLIDNGQMTEVDWNDAEEDIRTYINELFQGKNYPFQLPYEDRYDGKPVETMLRLMDEQEIRPAGYAMALIDIQSDSFVFTILPTADKQYTDDLLRRL